MSKKGQSISINTIIVAAIALAVLVVLFVIFTGRLGIFSKGVSETASCANSCKGLGKEGVALAKDSCTSPNVILPGSYSEVTREGDVCCCK